MSGNWKRTSKYPTFLKKGKRNSQRKYSPTSERIQNGKKKKLTICKYIKNKS